MTDAAAEPSTASSLASARPSKSSCVSCRDFWKSCGNLLGAALRLLTQRNQNLVRPSPLGTAAAQFASINLACPRICIPLVRSARHAAPFMLLCPVAVIRLFGDGHPSLPRGGIRRAYFGDASGVRGRRLPRRVLHRCGLRVRAEAHQKVGHRSSLSPAVADWLACFLLLACLLPLACLGLASCLMASRASCLSLRLASWLSLASGVS